MGAHTLTELPPESPAVSRPERSEVPNAALARRLATPIRQGEPAASARNPAPITDDDIQLYSEAAEFIADNWHLGITLHDIARQFDLSPFHLHRRFKEIRGTTPKQAIFAHQIARAKEYLTGETPLAEIAKSCGFCGQSHLSDRFKDATGLTPSEYRKQHRQASQASAAEPKGNPIMSREIVQQRNAFEAAWRRGRDEACAEQLEKASCCGLSDLRGEVRKVIDLLNAPVDFGDLQAAGSKSDAEKGDLQ